jgi:hypothetical protein
LNATSIARFASFAIFLMGFGLLTGLVALPVSAQGETDPCEAIVLSQNCRFQRPVGSVAGFGVVYHGWWPYVVAGTTQFDDQYHGNSYDPDDMVNGGREQSFFTSNTQPWHAGLYQQVNNVVPGHAYFARAGWFVSQNITIIGRIGIDPKGGTNPASPDIVWGEGRPLDHQTRINIRGVYAQTTTVTVFIEATSNTPRPGGDRVWLTAVSLSPDAMYTAVVFTPTATGTPVPTNTRPAPTRTATPIPPTPTQTPIVTVVPTATAQDTATATATPTETDTPTPIPTATRRPTATPTQTATPEAQLAVMGVAGVAAGLIGLAGCSLFFAVVFTGVVFWAWRRYSQSPEDRRRITADW